MKQTNNFFLKLFEGMDTFDYKVINENWQKVDDAIQELLHGGNVAVLPTMTIEKIESGYKITVTDAKGSQTFSIGDGKTAYQYAKDGGFTGTETEFKEMFAKINYTYGTDDIEAGSASSAPTGTLHFVYE